ncbi:hypothetical protein PIB30_065832, partial [Stylosanthes scabra]|nr:hypothetical protein [Stylosanthes scabra]
FVYKPYNLHHLLPNLTPGEFRAQQQMWSTPSPLISFECVEWHPTLRINKRQFGLPRHIPAPASDLGTTHNECLTGPKNKNPRAVPKCWPAKTISKGTT